MGDTVRDAVRDGEGDTMGDTVGERAVRNNAAPASAAATLICFRHHRCLLEHRSLASTTRRFPLTRCGPGFPPPLPPMHLARSSYRFLL